VGIGGVVSSGCALGVAEAAGGSEDAAGGLDGDVSGAGLVADAQATTRRPTTITIATREVKGRI
jgi:hypothetical protein